MTEVVMSQSINKIRIKVINDEVVKIESEINKYLCQELPKAKTQLDTLSIVRKISDKYLQRLINHGIVTNSNELFQKYIKPKYEDIKEQQEEKQKLETLNEKYYNLFYKLIKTNKVKEEDKIKKELLNLTDDMVKFGLYQKEQYISNINDILNKKRKKLITTETTSGITKITIKEDNTNNILSEYGYFNGELKGYIKYTYNKDNKLILEEYFDKDNKKVKSYKYKYYEDGINLKHKIELNKNDEKIVKYKYNNLGKLIVKNIYNNGEKEEIHKIKYSDDIIEQCTYNKNGLLVEKRFYDKDVNLIGKSKFKYINDQIIEGVYNEHDKLVKQNHYNKYWELEEYSIFIYNNNEKTDIYCYDKNEKEIKKIERYENTNGICDFVYFGPKEELLGMFEFDNDANCVDMVLDPSIEIKSLPNNIKKFVLDIKCGQVQDNSLNNLINCETDMVNSFDEITKENTIQW